MSLYVILLNTKPTKDGYVFDGWVNEKGETIEIDSILKKDTTLKATWKALYTCPSDCTVSEDKKTYSKTSTTDLIVNTGCPSGYTQSGNSCTITETISCTVNIAKEYKAK